MEHLLRQLHANRTGPSKTLRKMSAFWALLAALFSFLFSSYAHAQEVSLTERMAQTIMRVCVAGMRSGETLTLENFGNQFVFHEVKRGDTWLKHARGQPWIRLAINGSRSGSCTASFSQAAGNSFQTAASLANEIRRLEGMGAVTVPGMRAAFTFQENQQTFDHNRDPYIGYLNVGGYQVFFFVPVLTDARAPKK